MFCVYWLVHFTHLVLFVDFWAKQGTTQWWEGGGGILQKARDERRARGKGKEKKIIHYYFLLPLILRFALVSLFVWNVPFASLGLQNVPVMKASCTEIV